MPEATVIILDASAYMRNGDYTPSRMEAQIEAIQAICGARFRKNPQNQVGIVSACTQQSKILTTLTSDIGKILSGLHGIPMGGKYDLKGALLVAVLMLQNRIDPILTQRIILFVGSPVQGDDDLIRVIETLRANNIALDIISFGEVTDNAPLIETFPALLEDSALVVTVPPGPHVLIDMIAKTDVVMRDGGLCSFDPQFDPELADAIQASLQDYQSTQTNQPYNEDEELARALALSLQENYAAPQQPPAAQPASAAPPEARLNIDPELEMTIRASLEQYQQQQADQQQRPMEEENPADEKKDADKKNN